GMSALASQAAVSLMNNKGDISKTFKDMGSKSSVKSLVTSMAIGGALSGFDAAIGGDSAAKGAKIASTTSARLPQLSHGDWSKVAQRVAGQSIISSSLNTAINGGSFKDNLATALLTSAGSQLHAEGAHLIGDDGAVLGVSGKALSHALVAGVAAEIGGGNAKGAAAGALAAELAGVVMGDNIVGSQQWQEKQAQFSRVAGAIAGVLATGKVEGAYSGANAGEVVDRFNRQLHLDEIKAVNELAKGSNVKQERFLAASCRQVNCTAQEALNSAERARAELLMAKYPETPEEDGILRNYWIQKEKKRFGNYPALTGFEQIQLFTYADADKLSDSQKFAKNQWVEEASNLTGWSREAVEALGISASLAGVVRGKRFGQTGAAYPTGISFNINQKNHLAKFDGFTQKTGIKGAHNADEFYIAANQHHVKIISETPGSVKGITQITYQIPAYDRAGKVIGYKAAELPKTIYDPKIFTDQKMLDLGQRASAIGYKEAMISKNGTANAIVEGITFRIYVDKNTGMVRNFHPQQDN
ncbi:heme utilization protein, partial [Yersinia enterocolitica]|nr:heme utilization protein [Yersinia enterocolitica]